MGCEDFLTGDLLDNDPNKVDDVSIISIESLLVGSQVSMYGVMEAYLNRMVTMVMQQMAGQKLEYYSDYNCSFEANYDQIHNVFSNHYGNYENSNHILFFVD